MDSFLAFRYWAVTGISPGKKKLPWINLEKNLWIVYPPGVYGSHSGSATTAMYFVVFNFLKVCKKVVFSVLPCR